MTMPTANEHAIEVRERIAVAAGAALLAAGLILVTVILPAEYGVDPLGTGARLGLVELGAMGQKIQALSAASAAGSATGQPAIVPQEREFKGETVEFKVGPRKWMEYKYRLDKGEALLYSWKATSPVGYELHAEPDGAPRGYAESYEKEEAKSQVSGTLTAPFSGIHGWYWENRGGQEVTITLMTAGFYNMAHEFRDGAAVTTKMFK